MAAVPGSCVNPERRSHVNLVTLPGAETLGRRRPGLRYVRM